MARPKNENGPGKRVNIYILQRHVETAEQIDNLSAFVQIALDQAADIMAWAMLKEYDPKKYNTDRKLEDQIDDFNQKYPQDPLTQKRTGKWPKRSANIQDVL